MLVFKQSFRFFSVLFLWENQLTFSAGRWQHGSKNCFPKFFKMENHKIADAQQLQPPKKKIVIRILQKNGASLTKVKDKIFTK